MKIPLERTIGDTYKFVFSNILSIFGIAWLPAVIMVALIAGAVFALLPDFSAMDWSATPDVAHNQAILAGIGFKVIGLVFPIEFLIYLLFAMVQVGLLRKALGLIAGLVFVYFSLSSAVWRLFGGMIAAFVLFVIGGCLTFTAVSVVYWLGQHYAFPGIYGLVEFFATIAAICWFFYMGVRLFFFIPPAVVAEGGFGIARSWQLGAGNFWRTVVIILAAVAGPMIVISTISQIVFMPFFGSAMLQIQHAAADNQQLSPQQIWAIFGPALRIVIPIYIGLQIVTMPIVFGLSAAVSAFAYRNLTLPESAV
ncbi:MAG: hypothetical protein WDM89_15480 [Rhizomicrobium sp.]